MWNYFDIPLSYYNIYFLNISYYSDGVMALQSNSIIIGARKHWYSTEQILKYGGYNSLIIEKGLIDIIYNSIAYNIRKINKRICSVYFKPTLKYISIVRYNLKKIFHMSMNINYTSMHLRIGDVDKQPFQKYINKTELHTLIISLKKIKNKKILLISDSLTTKFKIKNELGKIVYTDFNLPCHSRNSKCLNQSMNDIMMMINSEYLILTRGSTFSLFGSYFSKCKYRRIIFIGHDYEHNNYYG